VGCSTTWPARKWEIRGIGVHSRVNVNNDGIDIDGSQRVRISDAKSLPATTPSC